MNAVNDEVTCEIVRTLKEFKDDPGTRGFIITGYGTKAFSAGVDIKELPNLLGDRHEAAEYARGRANIQLFISGMDKPVVAAINGDATGSGLDLAIGCHSIIATTNARFQFPEITMGISPGAGGSVIMYRKWPAGSRVFHEMLCLGKTINTQEALSAGMLSAKEYTYYDMIMAAIKEVDRLQGSIPEIPDGKINIPDIELPEEPFSGKLRLSKEAVSIISKTIILGASKERFVDALEAGYYGFGDAACTEAAKEGITAFLNRRQPVFTK